MPKCSMVKSISPVVNSFQELGSNMQFYADRFRRNVGVMALKAGIVGLETVAVRTPVDTSEARSNWNLGTAVVTVRRPPHVQGRHLGIGERGAFASVVAEGKRNAQRIRPEDVAGGTPVIVSNPTPYIGLLNAGFSPQNPEGNFDMVAVQLIQGFLASYIRQGTLLTKFDTL